jgi:hypothetical protein
MASELRLVWSSPLRRAPGLSPLLVVSPPRAAETVGQALVDEWLTAPWGSRADALDDLARRIDEAVEAARRPSA